MSTLWASAAPLLGLALLCRVLFGRGQPDAGWTSWVEIPRTLILGVLFAVLSAWVLAPIHAGIDPQIAGDRFVSSITADFHDYCGAIGMYRSDVFDVWPSKRSRGAGWLAGELSHSMSILDALSWAAVISASAVGSGLYLWGRILGGPIAGVAAVTLALAMSPMPLLSRMLTFYPMITASLVLSAAFTAGAIRYRSPGWVLLAGAGIGACLLTDVRGLVWALPYFFGVLGVVLVWPFATQRGRIRAGLVGLLVLPLGLSWSAGDWAYPVHAQSLEEQADVRELFELHGATGAEFTGRNTLPSEFVWGHADTDGDGNHTILEIPDTLLFLLDQSETEKPPEMREPSPGAAAAQLDPWLGIWLLCGCIVVFGSVWQRGRRPGLPTREDFLGLVALAVTVLPFLVALKGVFAIREMQVRFLTQIMPAMAVLMALSFAWLLTRGGPWLPKGLLVRSWPKLQSSLGLDLARALVPGAALVWLVLGNGQSFWTAEADWRTNWKPGTKDLHHTASLSADGGFSEGVRLYCFSGVAEDREAGWSGGLTAFPDSSVTRLDLGNEYPRDRSSGGQAGPAAGPNSRGAILE